MALPSCPYCGGPGALASGMLHATLAHGGSLYRSFVTIHCDNCGCGTGPKDTFEQALDDWQRGDIGGEGRNALNFPYRHPSELH